MGLDWNSSALAVTAGVDRTMSRPLPRRTKLRPADRFKPVRRDTAERAFRPELVSRVRREIADGTYDGESKFEAALDRLALLID